MQTFDCLSRNIPLLGPHFLEASAGTGKTFAIEHIAARLLLSGEATIEQVLIVTFTRAAARELKLRIRSNLEQIQKLLASGSAPWDYLEPFLGDAKALARIGDGLVFFDRAQIFTIHSFCYRMVREYAFEAGLGFGVQEASASNSIDTAMRDFFESKLSLDLVAPEQLGIAIVKYKTVEGLARKIKKQTAAAPSKTFAELQRAFEETLASYGALDLTLLREDFEALRSNYKAAVKGRFEKQILDFRSLLSEQGTLFKFLSPENRKVKAKPPAHLHYPGFFDWAIERLYPIVLQAIDPNAILQVLFNAWQPIAERIAKSEERFGPDDILRAMGEAVQKESFRTAVQQKYRAVLIDEFQDTDPIQWDIFQRLFIHHSLYLVGDPKQSIYRFRNADLYTYLKAKEAIAPERHYYLDTNYRSSKELIGALNRIFDRQWLSLPKQGTFLPYIPVRAGLDTSSDLGDGKGAVHCFRYSDVEQAHRYIAREILRLNTTRCAILVKDRHSGFAVQKVLREAGIQSIARANEPLCETLAYEVIWELLEALFEPKVLGKAKVVLAGPLSGLSSTEIKEIDFSPFLPLREHLDRLGFAPFCQLLWDWRLGKTTVREQIAANGLAFYSDCHQVLEALFEWERSEGFSFEGAFRFLESLHQMDPDDTLSRRSESDADAVQIMTMHASKGLEFEFVFALGLAARTPAGDEEADAEKLRQLYVAMTRAKRRLYIPLATGLKQASNGTLSPIELFNPSHLTEDDHLTMETIEDLSVALPAPSAIAQSLIAPSLALPTQTPSHLLSFTTLATQTTHEPLAPLAPPNGLFTPHNLPRGPETGVAIHAIFEKLFGKERVGVASTVEERLSATPLAPWKEAVVQMVQETLRLPLAERFCLQDIDRNRTIVETEFIFGVNNDFVKGFIDLIFEHEGQLYIVDWKTNWLGDDSSHYTQEKMREAVYAHQYDLQAKLYAESLRRSGRQAILLYVFVRGPAVICLKEKTWRN